VVQDALAYALERLGMLEKGESGRPHLQEAIAIDQALLKSRSPDRNLTDWLSAQNNLARTEAELGQRELGLDHLQQAVQAYRDELKYLSPERSPELWKQASEGLADAQNRLAARGVAG
jgi:hypothetical protein